MPQEIFFHHSDFIDATKAKLFYEAMFFVIIFTYINKLIIQVQYGNVVLNRVVLCLLKCIKLALLLSTPGQFGPVLLP